MLKKEWVQKATGSYCTYSIPGKTAALVPECVVEDLSLAELQPMFLHLQFKTYPWAGLSLQTQAPRPQICPKAGLPLQTQEPRLQFY